jgi:hypothetical protein
MENVYVMSTIQVNGAKKGSVKMIARTMDHVIHLVVSNALVILALKAKTVVSQFVLISVPDLIMESARKKVVFVIRDLFLKTAQYELVLMIAMEMENVISNQARVSVMRDT